MQPFGPHHVGRKPMVQWLEHGRRRTDLIGQRRQTQRHNLAAIALDLPVSSWCCPYFSNSSIARKPGLV
jgi:hypothetical protein